MNYVFPKCTRSRVNKVTKLADFIAVHIPFLDFEIHTNKVSRVPLRLMGGEHLFTVYSTTGILHFDTETEVSKLIET